MLVLPAPGQDLVANDDQAEAGIDLGCSHVKSRNQKNTGAQPTFQHKIPVTGRKALARRSADLTPLRPQAG